ncbi:ABC multidrug transporter [Xylariaceae sp. FL1651]|nr:ABC multidrug transporter [Xylariaceae sp. FL1651]
MACNADGHFGPTLPLEHDPCRLYDFTLLFEHLFFTLLPSLIIIVIAVLRTWNLIKQPDIIGWPALRVTKCAILFLLGALHLTQVAILTRDSHSDAQLYSRLAIPASSLAFIAAISLTAASWFEHSRSPGPSLLLQTFIILTLAPDVACLRSSWLIAAASEGSSRAFAGTQGAVIILKVASLGLESLGKPAAKYLTVEHYQDYSPEQRCGLFGRTFLSWLYPTFRSGYRKSLTPDDLCCLETCLSGSTLQRSLVKSWSAAATKNRWRLVVALTATFYADFIIINLLRFGLVAFMVAQPLLVQTTLSYINDYAAYPVFYGHGLIAAYALNYIGIAISTMWSQHLTFRLLAKVRGALIGLIFRFCFQIPARDSAGSAKAVNLMSTEVDRISQTLQWAVHIIPNALQLALGLWILSSYLHAATVVPVVIPARQSRWMQSIQTRVKKTTTALSHINAVKILGLDPVVASQVQKAREAEMQAQKSFRQLQVTNIAIAFDVVAAFSSLALLSILVMPIAELVTVPANLLSALSCLDRIQAYLLEADHADPRVSIGEEPCITMAQYGHMKSDKEKLRVSMGAHAHMLDAAIRTPVISMSTESQMTLPLVDIRNGSFSWPRQDAFLRAIDLQVYPADLVIVTGSIGAGKSMLLKSILGETNLTDGSLACLPNKEIGYCAQEPWIPNMRLREVILGSSPYHAARYAEVVQLCQLTGDIDHMIDKDEMMVGNGGSRLSGGQKQRLQYRDTGRWTHPDHKGQEEDCAVVELSPTSPTIKSRATAQGARQIQETRELTMAINPRKESSLVFYMRSMGRLRLLIFVALTVTLVGLNVGQTIWLKAWVSQSNLDWRPDVGYWAGIYVLLGVLSVLSIAAQTGAPILFFATHDTGTVLSLFTNDLNLMDLPLSLSFLMTCEKLTATFAELALTSLASGYLALSIPVLAILIFLLQRIYGRTSRGLRVLDLAAKAPLLAHFVESFDGRETIRAFGWFNAAERQNLKYLDASQRSHYLLFCLQRWLALVLDLIAAGLATLLVALAVALRHSIDPASLGVGLVSVMGFGQVFTQFVTNWSNLDASLGAVSRVKKFVAETPVEATSSYCGLEVPASWPSRGQVKLSNVSCSYGPARVIAGITLRFEAGTKTAICGRTGSGKSSLLSVLLRLIELDSGVVEMDDVDILQVPLDRLRRAIVAVPQDILFLDGSVRFNLDPHRDVDLNDDALLAVLRNTGLEKLIDDSGGLDAELCPERLSSGQAQLFCLARAMLRAMGKSAGVLLLDEATSHLDYSTAERMNMVLASTFRTWTVLAVTHDPRSVLEHGFHRVVVLDEGLVVEDGEPQALLRRQDSYFRDLWRASSNNMS